MISRRAVAAVAALTVTALATLGAAEAAPAAHLAASRYPTGLRPIHGGSDDAAFVDGTATVRKARTVVTLPRVLLRSYANETSKTKNHILTAASPSWAVTHIGRHPRFGIFPVAHSAVLGFGAIPITADLHLSQLVRHGQIVPIVVHSKTRISPPFHAYPAHVIGDVDVRISNVLVDRVPLHVGPDCHSAVPMHLNLVGGARDYTLFQGGPLRGTVTIPPFTGCGIGGDNLDPLLTGTISGPGNKIVQIQGNLGPWNTRQKNDCGLCRPPKH
jgi:hypothetical protein